MPSHKDQGNLKLMTWNIGLDWKNSGNFQGAWPFDQVTGLINEQKPDIVCLQEVPCYESAQKKHYYCCLEKDLQNKKYVVYNLSRGENFLLTAVKGSRCGTTQSPFESKINNNLPVTININKRKHDIINVHLKAGNGNNEYNQLKNELCEKKTGDTWIAGDFNYQLSLEKTKSGCLYVEENGNFKGSLKWKPDQHLDYIIKVSTQLGKPGATIGDLSKNSVIQICPNWPPNIRPKKDTHFHRPVVRTISFKD